MKLCFSCLIYYMKLEKVLIICDIFMFSFFGLDRAENTIHVGHFRIPGIGLELA